MKIYTIHDSKAGFYGQPFYARQHGEAIRSFTSAVSDASNPNNQMATYPADFTLFYIGEYDEQTAKIDPAVPVNLGNGLELRSSQQ